MNPDIACIIETRLKDDNKLYVQGYQWFGHNRYCTHVKAKKGSGGIGVLVSNKLLNSYKVDIIDKNTEGILAIKCTRVISNYQLVIIVCYLPPENSPWGKNVEMFFAYLISIIYVLSEIDQILIVGDFNAKIGSLQDIVENDVYAERKILDNTKNNHGESLIEFLRDSKMCILNGRVNSDNNDYTFISTRGKSIIDYMITQHEDIEKCKHFEIIQVADIIQKFNLFHCLSSTCKQPDHAILFVELYAVHSMLCNGESLDNFSLANNKKRFYNLRKIPNNFLSSAYSEYWLNNILSDLTNGIITVDAGYDCFCSTVFKELDKNKMFSSTCVTNDNDSKKKNIKPYWDSELEKLWTEMKILEKQFLRCRNKSNKLQMRENYTYQRSKFDKLLRLKERKFNTNKLQEIEYNSKHSPNEFWKAVQKLGPSKKSTRHTGPFVLKNGIISYNLNIIRQKWFLDFQNLYNASAIHDGCLSRTFYSYVLKEVEPHVPQNLLIVICFWKNVLQYL